MRKTRPIIHICYGGPIRTMRLPSGRVVTFEDHPYLGPIATRPDGEPRKNGFSDRSPFWPLHDAWCAAGKPVDALGRCRASGDLFGEGA